MKTRFLRKYLLILAFGFPALFSYSQIESFGTNSKRKRLTQYKYAAYGYFDCGRELGIGMQHQAGPNWSLDVSAFYIRPNSFFKMWIHEWDYYDFKGFGIAVTPKFHPGKRGLYIGLSHSLEYLEHQKIPVAYYWGKGYDLYYDYDSCYGWGSTTGFTVGSKLLLGKLKLDPFFTLGTTIAKLKRTTYSSTSAYQDSRQFPYRLISVQQYVSLNFGLKIGFEFKKNKKDMCIDAKFDNIYIPRYSKLVKYMEAVDFKKLAYPKPVRRADKKIKKANKIFIRIHQRTYHDTTEMYRRIENYFDEIDKLIEEGRK